jgi:2-oxoisovalerate dehydrogenase E1 component
MKKIDFEGINIEDFFLALKIRLTEQKLLDIYSKGLLRGTVHTCVGQEFSAVLISKYLDSENDWILSTHRGHGHFIAFNGSPFELFAELLGKKEGPSKGKGGSQHIKKGNFITNGVQGGFTSVANGIASVLTDLSKSNICVNFIGDGTLGEGSVWESLNIAAFLVVPSLFVCEDNGIAQSTLTINTFRGNLPKRVEGFGVKYFYASLEDLEKAEVQIKNAVDYVRKNQIPAFLHIKTQRLNAHSKGDDNRDPKFISKIAQKDQLNQFITKKSKEFENAIHEIQEIVDSDFEKASKLLIDISTPQKLSQNKIIPKFVSRELKSEVFRVLLNKSLEQGLIDHPKLKIYGEDIEYLSAGTTKPYGGAFKVTNQLSELFPTRVNNFPIAENALVGTAIGRALVGSPTIVEIMFGDFITLAFDQIVQNLSKLPTMYGNTLDLPIVIRTPMGGGFGYGATHSQSLEKHFLGLPNITLLAVNLFSDLGNFYSEILNSGSPHIVIENKRDYFIIPKKSLSENFDLFTSENVYKTHHIAPKTGKPVATFLTYGGMSSLVHAAQEKLLEKGITTNLVIIEKLSPLNCLEFITLIKETLIIIEEGLKQGGVGSEVLSQLLELNKNPKNILRISGSGLIGSSKNSEELALPTLESIYNLSLVFLEKSLNESN